MTIKRNKKEYSVYYSKTKSTGWCCDEEMNEYKTTKVLNHLGAKKMRNAVKEICKSINNDIDKINPNDINVKVSEEGIAHRNITLMVGAHPKDNRTHYYWYLSVTTDDV